MVGYERILRIGVHYAKMAMFSSNKIVVDGLYVNLDIFRSFWRVLKVGLPNMEVRFSRSKRVSL